ncbi:hypothetical protein KUW17_10520 [Leisingera aquaemixtae]|uniref:hypothetical protein n=1 Tax=Leisingera TaxID=191028 RepID=UPI001C97780C|nr:MULTISPECIES: hypothetical protein [Leisingera]MBY6067175.1 hypothetical protein [Leisingera aquaemixtae]MCB4456597.1 hypothetical protein [Leisingera sp. McT4-56]
MRQFVPADFEKAATDLDRLKEAYFAAGCDPAVRETAEAALAAAMRWISVALDSYDRQQHSRK